MDKINIGTGPLLYPMPVALVGTTVEGRASFTALGWLCTANENPPMLVVAVEKSRHAPAGIRDTKTFGVSFPGAAMVEDADYRELASGEKGDKQNMVDIFYGELETAPMITKCPLCLECRLVDEIDLPTNTLFIGEIVASYTEPQYLTDGKPDPQKMDLLVSPTPVNLRWTVRG